MCKFGQVYSGMFSWTVKVTTATTTTHHGVWVFVLFFHDEVWRLVFKHFINLNDAPGLLLVPRQHQRHVGHHTDLGELFEFMMWVLDINLYIKYNFCTPGPLLFVLDSIIFTEKPRNLKQESQYLKRK